MASGDSGTRDVLLEDIRSTLRFLAEGHVSHTEKFDAMGNKIVTTKKKVKLSSAEARKKKKGKLKRDLCIFYY